jgi:hypothetical protein
LEATASWRGYTTRQEYGGTMSDHRRNIKCSSREPNGSIAIRHLGRDTPRDRQPQRPCIVRARIFPR